MATAAEQRAKNRKFLFGSEDKRTKRASDFQKKLKEVGVKKRAAKAAKDKKRIESQKAINKKLTNVKKEGAAKRKDAREQRRNRLRDSINKARGKTTTPKKTTTNTGPSKAKGGGTKPNKNTTTTKPKNTTTNTKPKNTKPKNTKPKNTGPSKAKGGSKISGPTKGLIAVGTTVPFLFGNKSKESKDSSTNTTNPKKDRDFRKRLQQDDAYSMDKMLDKKQEKAINNMDRQKRESQSIGGGFGAGVNFSSKDVSKLKENARKLTSQINNLDITSMQKKRLKDELNTRKKNFGMGESYQKSFDTIRNKVKNKKFN